MSRHTLNEREIAWIRAHPLSRLATVDADGRPQNNPVMAYYNEALGTVDVGGHNMVQSRKYANAQLPGARAALVVDEIEGHDPTTIKLLEIRGPIAAVPEGDPRTVRAAGPVLRLSVARIISWGL